jgi:hypothetical protein
MSVVDALTLPVALATRAGAPGGPEYAAGLSTAGALGVVPGGGRSRDEFAADVAAARAATDRPLGAELAVDGGYAADPARYRALALRFGGDAPILPGLLGHPRFRDDALEDKVAVLTATPIAVVAYTSGLPPEHCVHELRAVGTEVWVTVATPHDAEKAAECGADALIIERANSLMATPAGLPRVMAGLGNGAELAAVLAAGAMCGLCVVDPETAPPPAMVMELLTGGARDALTGALDRLDHATTA